jgi:hypothetical protein
MTKFDAGYRQESNQTTTPRADVVWLQLSGMYGKAVFREYGEEPPTLWVQAISRLTDAQIKNGLASLGNQALSFPPNLSQFVVACKNTPANHWKTLPAPEYDRQAEAERAWSDMERLAGKKLER